MPFISLLAVLLIFCLVLWCARMLLGAFGIGDPIASIIQVVIVIVFVLWLVQALGLIGGPVIHLR